MADANPTGSNYLTDISQIIGTAGKDAASGRAQEGQYLNARDAIMAHLYQIQQDAATKAAAQNLSNAKFTTSLPGVGATEAARGSLLANSQDAGVDLGHNHANVINFSGGTRPSSFTPETRQAGSDLIAHGQQLIAKPDSFLPPTSGAGVNGGGYVQTPSLSPQPTAGFWGNAAAPAALTTGLLGALAKAMGGGNGGGGDLGKAAAALKNFFTGNHNSGGPDQGPDPFGAGGEGDQGPWWYGMPKGGGGEQGGTPDVSTDYNFNTDPNLGDNGNGFDWGAWLEQQQNGGGGEQGPGSDMGSWGDY